MKRTLTFLLAAVLLIATTNCASIVSKSKYPVNFVSNPAEANIKITDRKGNMVYAGTTPALVQLKAGNGFFSKAIYNVTYSKEGYKDINFPVEATIDGWYFGNIVFGGLIGLLIVDPATGAMFRISQDYYSMALEENNASAKLDIYSIDDIPEEWKSNLVKIN